MTFIPNVLLRRAYKKGSLRSIEGGLAIDVVNVLGPGILTGLNYVLINDYKYDPEDVCLLSNGTELRADKVSTEKPLFFTFKQKVTLVMKGNNPLKEGKNEISLEVISREAGVIKVNFSDNITAK